MEEWKNGRWKGGRVECRRVEGWSVEDVRRDVGNMRGRGNPAPTSVIWLMVCQNIYTALLARFPNLAKLPKYLFKLHNPAPTSVFWSMVYRNIYLYFLKFALQKCPMNYRFYYKFIYSNSYRNAP